MLRGTIFFYSNTVANDGDGCFCSSICQLGRGKLWWL